jgi:tetratricopeptide (TPR) repeat protein
MSIHHLWPSQYRAVVSNEDVLTTAKRLLMGFNRQEAAEYFKHFINKSAPSVNFELAFAYWGVAYCNGTDYNMYGPVYEQIRKSNDWPSLEIARKYSKKAVEFCPDDAKSWKNIFLANSKRFQHLDLKKYAYEMASFFSQDEKDALVIAVHAESRMNLEPWSLWDRKTMKPTKNAEHARSLIDLGLNRESENVWLCHLKVHFTEMGPKEQFADEKVLKSLKESDNGHLRHMPSHIYIQQGKYMLSRDLNIQAVEIDSTDRRRKLSSLSIYSFYECHNMHFIVFASCMCGDYDNALKFSEKLEYFVIDRLREGDIISKTLCEAFLMIRPMVYVRFGKWDEIRAHTFDVTPDSKILDLFFHYAQCIANASLSDRNNLSLLDEAKTSLEKFDTMGKSVVGKMMLHNQDVDTIVKLAKRIAQAEILYREHVLTSKNDVWKKHLNIALQIESRLNYDEPPAWMIPVRQTMAALFLEQSLKDDAYYLAQEDLKLWPNNIWSAQTVNRCYPGSFDIKQMTDVDVSQYKASCACATTMF